MPNLRYITASGDVLAYDEGDRTVIVESWQPEFAALVAMGPDAYAPPQITAEDLIARLAARRYAAEEGGTMFGGQPLSTDRTTQTKITAAYVKASADPGYTIAAWKFAPGVFAPLDAATIIAVANALEAHVQACFANEAAISAQIMAAATPEALEAIDIEQGWP